MSEAANSWFGKILKKGRNWQKIFYLKSGWLCFKLYFDWAATILKNRQMKFDIKKSIKRGTRCFTTQKWKLFYHKTLLPWKTQSCIVWRGTAIWKLKMKHARTNRSSAVYKGKLWLPCTLRVDDYGRVLRCSWWLLVFNATENAIDSEALKKLVESKLIAIEGRFST